MAKRYYNGRADFKVGLGAEHYAGMDQRKKEEHHDFSMISDDPRACANLPQNVMYHDWRPGQHFMSAEFIDDTDAGINREQSQYQSAIQKGIKPRKA